MFATTLALIAQEFQGPERATAFGIWGATIGGAVAIGPLVGGALTDAFGWEWIFFVNVPIGIGAIVAHPDASSASRRARRRAGRLAGVVTFSSALFLLVFALVRGNAEGWSSAQITRLADRRRRPAWRAFIAIERAQRRTRCSSSTLFRKPAFVGVSIVAFSLSAWMFAMFLYLTHLHPGRPRLLAARGRASLPADHLALVLRRPDRGPALEPGARCGSSSASGLGLVGVGLLLMHGVEVDSTWTDAAGRASSSPGSGSA